MENKIIIKNIVKFEDYDLKSFNNDLQLIGLGKKTEKKDAMISTRQLIKATYRLGKEFNKCITEYFERKKMMGDNFIQCDSLEDKNCYNKKLLKEIEAFCNIDNKTPNHYFAMYDFYTTAYKLIPKDAENGSKLMPPEELLQYISSYEQQSFGIYIDSEYIYQLFIIENNYKKMFEILKEQESKLDYKGLLPTINYIPVNIKNNFYKLFSKLPKKDSMEYRTLLELLSIIKSYCDKFGMPFWTDREDIAEITKIKQPNAKNTEIQNVDNMSKEKESKFMISSEYKLCNNIIPIQNLLFISCIVYLYTDLWDGFLDKNDFDLDLEKYKYAFEILGFSFLNTLNRKETINYFFEYAEIMDDYIMNNCNSIYNFPLKNIRKKVLYKINNTKSGYYNEIIYESVIIAAWNTFYLDYFGNSKIKEPYPHCATCGKEIMNKPHTIETKEQLCDVCFEARKKEQNKNRVTKCRNSN